jgi:hypothetical protein
MFSLVGHRQGRRIIRWGHVLKVMLLLTASSTLTAAGLYFLLAGQWSLLAVEIGAGAGFVVSVATLIISLCTPLERLPIIK